MNEFDKNLNGDNSLIGTGFSRLHVVADRTNLVGGGVESGGMEWMGVTVEVDSD